MIEDCRLLIEQSTINNQQSAISNPPAWSLEVVSDPDRELRRTEPLVPGGIAVQLRLVGKLRVFPVLVEQRAPRPVEVDGESEREGFQAEAVRGAAVLQAEPADRRLRAIHRNLIAARVGEHVPRDVLRVSE